MKQRFYVTIGVFTALSSFIAGGTQAALPPPPPTPTVQLAPRGGSGPLVSVKADNLSLADVAKDLETQSKATIWVEPGILTKVTATLNRQPLETVLMTLVGEGGPTVVKVSLLQKKDAVTPTGALSELSRGFNALGTETLSAQLAGGAGQVAMAQLGTNLPILPSPKDGETLTTAYLIANPGVAGTARAITTTGAVGAYNAASQQRRQLLDQMAPQDRQKAMQDEISQMINLPLDARMQMMMDRRAAWQGMPDDMRQQLRDSMRQARQALGWGGRGNRGNRGNGNNGGNNGGNPPTP